MAFTELERIEQFLRPFDRGGAGVIAGPGDDCALTRVRPGRILVTKVDELVAGVHFGPAFRPEEVGHKALAVALSDLAAAGAEPRWFLVALSLPPALPDRWISGIARGMSRLAREHDVALVGGNVTRAGELSLAVTVIGEAAAGRALRRSGGRPGDAVVVSGTLGRAALGLKRLARGRPRRLGPCERAQLTPAPRLELSRVVAAHAAAAIDLSDGLLRDLGHLCARSGVGAELELAAMPIAPAVKALGREGLELALAGGEDYELLVAVRPSKLAALSKAAARAGVPVTAIGRLTSRPGIRLHDEAGLPLRLPDTLGFDHFPDARLRLGQGGVGSARS